jgi:hypothetical protein
MLSKICFFSAFMHLSETQFFGNHPLLWSKLADKFLKILKDKFLLYSIENSSEEDSVELNVLYRIDEYHKKDIKQLSFYLINFNWPT